jgi:hypothetical protein
MKQWHQRAGDFDNAGGFHYRERECERKLARKDRKLTNPRSYQHLAVLWLYRLLYGYGERPWRVVIVAFIAILFFALFYVPWSHVDITAAVGLRGFFTQSWKALYFSGVSFTALGYGGWIENANEDIVPTGWTRYLGVVQSLFGVSLIALFLVTFTRNISR